MMFDTQVFGRFSLEEVVKNRLCAEDYEKIQLQNRLASKQ